MNPWNVYRIGWKNHHKAFWQGWRRPWQCENDSFTHLGARRAFTKRGALRRMVRACEKAGVLG